MTQSTSGATTLPDRAVVRLSGEDVRGFLNGLVTQDVAGGLPVWAGLLTPQGKCLFDFLVWADGDDLLLDVAADDAGALVKRLAIYRLRRPITIGVDGGVAIHWAAEGEQGVPDPRLPDLGRRWLKNAPAQGGAHDETRSSLSNERAYRDHRLHLGVCEGDELKDLLWLECNAAELNGVSFTKGCFVGQENTARMNWRQKVNRRLFVVEGENDKARAFYEDAGLSVVHARVDAVPDNAIVPGWLSASLL